MPIARPRKYPTDADRQAAQRLRDKVRNDTHAAKAATLDQAISIAKEKGVITPAATANSSPEQQLVTFLSRLDCSAIKQLTAQQ